MCSDPSCNGIPDGARALSSNGDQVIIGCCKQKEGYYCIWNLEHMGMVCEEWVEVCDLRKTIHEVGHISFNVVSQRQKARTAMNNLKKDAPFDECKRFPWRKVYVNLSCSVYGTLWQNILGALDFKDREAEKEMKFKRGQASDEDHHARNDYTLDDAKTQFRNSLKDFDNELCKRNEMYDRIRFENKYDLTWCLGPCPTEPSDNRPQEPPRAGTYGKLMEKLEELRLNPNDFRVFGPADIQKGDFQCRRETQELGPSMRNIKLPVSTERVFIFTTGEYSKCEEATSAVTGFIYEPDVDRILGPLDLKRWRSESFYTFEEFLRRHEIKSKYPNTRFNSSGTVGGLDIRKGKEAGKKSSSSIDHVVPGCSYADAVTHSGRKEFKMVSDDEFEEFLKSDRND